MDGFYQWATLAWGAQKIEGAEGQFTMTSHDVKLQEVMIKVEKQLSQLCRFIDSS